MGGRRGLLQIKEERLRRAALKVEVKVKVEELT